MCRIDDARAVPCSEPELPTGDSRSQSDAFVADVPRKNAPTKRAEQDNFVLLGISA
jgi:hypothetical protein